MGNSYKPPFIRKSFLRPGWRSIKETPEETDALIKRIIAEYCGRYNGTDLNRLNGPAVDSYLERYGYIFDLIPISSISLLESTRRVPNILYNLVNA